MMISKKNLLSHYSINHDLFEVFKEIFAEEWTKVNSTILKKLKKNLILDDKLTLFEGYKYVGDKEDFKERYLLVITDGLCYVYYWLEEKYDIRKKCSFFEQNQHALVLKVTNEYVKKLSEFMCNKFGLSEIELHTRYGTDFMFCKLLALYKSLKKLSEVLDIESTYIGHNCLSFKIVDFIESDEKVDPMYDRGIPGRYCDYWIEIINGGLSTLSHEWFHYLDDSLTCLCFTDFSMLSNLHLLKSMQRLVDSIIYSNQKTKKKSNYAIKSEMLDENKKKIYYSKINEMVARAFQKYISNKLMCTTTEVYEYYSVWDNDLFGDTFPQDKRELKKIYKCFDEFFDELKKSGIFGCHL